jgi:hypothetical protein
MPTLADKQIYLSLDGVNVSTYFVALELALANDPLDVTGGADVDHVQRAVGLNDARLSITLAYDADDVGDYLSALRPGVVISVIYGAQGNGTGMPRHEGSFVITRVKHGRSADKARVAFEIGAAAADTPAANMFTGGTFA